MEIIALRMFICGNLGHIWQEGKYTVYRASHKECHRCGITAKTSPVPGDPKYGWQGSLPLDGSSR
jgi:hypothetical protein